jgi:hypothetical protein
MWGNVVSLQYKIVKSKIMELAQNQTPTFESVWAALQETGRLLEKSRAEFDERLKESRAEFDARMKKVDQQREESRAEFEREMKESRERMKKLEKLTGSWANNHGFVAEEYFINSFEKGKTNFFGEKFDEIEPKIKGFKKGFKDEYDILLINGESIGIVEIKYKANETDVQEVIRKAETFRVNFPEYKNHRIYLGLASMAFYSELEKECIKQGIAVIKQVGDKMIINDTGLKVN